MSDRISKFTLALVMISAAFGAVVGVGATQIFAATDRPSCAETVMKAVSSNQTVHGTYQCFDAEQQAGLQTVGIDSDDSFTARVGQTGEYHYLHKTADGGYVYEYDRPFAPHDRFKGALGMLGVPRIAADLRKGDVSGAWKVPNDLSAAWSELTGASQHEKSVLFTFYLDGSGKIAMVK